MTQIKTKELEAVVLNRLSKQRAVHCLNVAKEAVKLAKNYGEDEEKAYVAGLLHDIQKEEDKDLLKQCVIDSKFEYEQVEIETPALCHAIASAAYARDKIGIEDIDILLAIRYHTIARDSMSELEQIVYLADLVSEDRTYPDVEIMRKKSYEELNEAMLYALVFSINDQTKKHGYLPCTTIKAYNYFLKKR